MNLSNKLFLISILFLIPLRSFSQPYFDVANFYYQKSPTQSLFHSNDNEIKSQLFFANFNVAIKLKEDYFIINPFFEHYQLNYSENKKFYGIGIPLTYRKQWKNSKWQTTFAIVPRINSDLDKVDANDYQIGGALLAIYKKSESLSFKFGVYYNSEFFGPFIIPLAGLQWNESERLNIFGVLPRIMNIEYKFNKHFYGGIELNFTTNSYRYDDYYFIRINDNYVKIYFDTYVNKNIVITLQAGQSFNRKYRTGFRENGVTHYNNLNVNDGLIIKAGLTYRLRLNEKK